MAAEDDGDNGRDEQTPGDRPQAPKPGNPRDDFNVVAGPWWGAGGCPDAETLAVFLEGRLPDPHHRRVGAHLHECLACRRVSTEVLAGLIANGQKAGEVDETRGVTATALEEIGRALAAELVAAPWESEPRDEEKSVAPEPARTVPPPPRRRKISAAALAAGVAAVLGVAVLLAWWSSSRQPRLLAASSPRERPYAARFTGDLPWAPVGSSHAATDYRLQLPAEALGSVATAERRGRPPEAPTAGGPRHGRRRAGARRACRLRRRDAVAGIGSPAAFGRAAERPRRCTARAGRGGRPATGRRQRERHGRGSRRRPASGARSDRARPRDLAAPRGSALQPRARARAAAPPALGAQGVAGVSRRRRRLAMGGGSAAADGGDRRPHAARSRPHPQRDRGSRCRR